MIGKMKKKTKKTFAVNKKKGKSTPTKTSKPTKDTSKPKKRPMTPDDSNAVPKIKKAKIEKTQNANESDKEKPQKTVKPEMTGVKSHKQEAEEAKEKKKMRKMREKKFYEVREEVKKLWEELRIIDLESKKRVQVTNDMFKLVEGKVVHLVFAHDTSRCVQSLVKFGSASQKETIFKELKSSFLKMMKSKFAKFCMRKFIKYGSKKHRAEIFNVFKGNVGVLLKHKEASEIVEMAYNDYANAQQRIAMEEEFYGPTFLVNKTPKVRNLVTFREEYPDKMAAVVGYMKEKLGGLVQKNILQLSFVHKLLYDFFEVADEASRSELIEGLKEHLPHLVHTRNGSRVAMRCLWFGSAKDRKVMVKSLKTYVLKICQEEQGHLVVLALLDCVDDTRLVCKAILDEFLKSLDEVVENQFSRKVLLYLLSPRNAMFFHPDIIKVLAVGDANPHSKKSTEVRRSELLTYLSTPLLKWLTPNVKKLTTDNNLLLLLLAIVNNVTGDAGELMKQVANMVAEPFPAKGFHFIDDSSGHLVLKKMIGRNVNQDKKKAELGGDEEKDEEGVDKDDDDPQAKDDKEEKKVEKDTGLFARVLMEVVDEEGIRSWIHCNRGCFVLVLLLELEDPVVTQKVTAALDNCKGVLKKIDSKGAKILLKKLP